MDEVERRLHRLLLTLRGQGDHINSNTTSWSTLPDPASNNKAALGDAFVQALTCAKEEGDQDDEQATLHKGHQGVENEVLQTETERLAAALKGSNILPLKKLVGLALPDASKTGPLAKLFAVNEALAGLLPPDERALWNGGKKELLGVPTWKRIAERIEDVEAVWEGGGTKETNPDTHNSAFGAQSALKNGAVGDEKGGACQDDRRDKSSMSCSWKSSISKVPMCVRA